MTCQTLAESVNALAAAHMSDLSQVKLTEENVKLVKIMTML
jgi:fructose/tagatose bisphosphate aldolase